MMAKKREADIQPFGDASTRLFAAGSQFTDKFHADRIRQGGENSCLEFNVHQLTG